MRKGTALLIVGIFLLIIGLGLSMLGVVMMGVSPEEYDEWINDSSRKQGDEITVTGTITEKSGGEILGFGLYKYRFENSDNSFYSAEDFAKEGDYVTVNIEINDMNLPEAKSTTNTQICLIPGIICLILGILLIAIGIRAMRKETKLQPQPLIQPGYPPTQYQSSYTTQQPQYQQSPNNTQPFYQPPPTQQPPIQPQQYSPNQSSPSGQPPRYQY